MVRPFGAGPPHLFDVGGLVAVVAIYTSMNARFSFVAGSESRALLPDVDAWLDDEGHAG